MSPQTDPRFTDSAGQPWAGRSFTPNPHAGDDGAVTPILGEALDSFVAGTVGQSAVVDALREARLLVPLVAVIGEKALNDKGQVVDKSADLSIVTVKGPDGRAVLPAFSRMETMSSWNPKARPVPEAGRKVALAAASEGTELIVIDPGSTTEFLVRRWAIRALVEDTPWLPPHEDPEVADAFARSVAGDAAVLSLKLEAGDPTAHGLGAELIVVLQLSAGLTPEDLEAGTAELSRRWAANEVIVNRVDSLRVRLAGAS